MRQCSPFYFGIIETGALGKDVKNKSQHTWWKCSGKSLQEREHQGSFLQFRPAKLGVSCALRGWLLDWFSLSLA